MTRSGLATGTVTWWRPEDGGGVVDGPDLPGSCWLDESVVDIPPGARLRAGQVVEVEWEQPGPSGYACRALRVALGDELETTPGG
jgi:cold shock CspA family protein